MVVNSVVAVSMVGAVTVTDISEPSGIPKCLWGLPILMSLYVS